MPHDVPTVTTPESQVSGRGRAFGMACFALFVGGVTAVMALQIILAVFAPERPPLSVACDEALSRMSFSLKRARQSAAARDGAEPSLAAFREGLGPAWQLEHSVEGQCGEGTSWALATKELIALRYAEERFARLGGRSLHQARSRVHELIPSSDP